MASFTETMLVIIGILIACDVAFLVALLTIDKRIRTLRAKKESKPLLQYEDPIQWLKHVVNFSVLSILLGFSYAFMISGLNIGISIANLDNVMLLGSVIFFLLSLFYILRVAHFIFDPASKANLITGKVIRKASQFLSRTLQIITFPLYAVLNIVILYQATRPEQIIDITVIIYAITVIMSLIVTPILTIETLRHPDKKATKRELITIFFFFLPWIVLFILMITSALGLQIT